jgi:hypothetical protein
LEHPLLHPKPIVLFAAGIARAMPALFLIPQTFAEGMRRAAASRPNATLHPANVARHVHGA